MKAMLIRRYGGPDVFEFGEIETPVINDDEMLVKVKGSSVNPVDAGIRRGLLKAFVRLKLPAVLGVDVSGEVVKTGGKVTRFKAGDNVYAFMGITRNGGYGEYISIPESYAARTPKNMSVEDAGVVPGVGMTAIEALTDIVKLQKGQKLLIVGATGGVGTFAIQIAKHLGAEVTAVCSTPNVEMAKSLGADEIIDYKREDFLNINKRFDAILNCHRQTRNLKLKKLLKPNGTVIVIAGNPLEIPLLKLSNILSGRKAKMFFVKLIGKNLELLTYLIEEEKVRVITDAIYSWDNLAVAHRQVESGRVTGKIGIKVG